MFGRGLRALAFVRFSARGFSELLAQRTTPERGAPLHISIGRMPFSLFIPEETLLQQAVQRYREFAGDGDRGLPVLLRRKNEAPLAGAFSFNLDDASLVLRPAGAEFHGVRHEYALDSLLRILLTVVLLPRRG